MEKRRTRLLKGSLKIDPTYYLTNQGTGYTSLWKLLETAPATADDTTSVTFPKNEYCWLHVKPGVANTEWHPYDLDLTFRYGWRTDSPLNGTFSAGDWTLYFTIITGKYILPFFIEVNICLYKGSQPDGSDATLIKWWSFDQYTTEQNTVYNLSEVLDAVPEITFSNEYLFLQLIAGTSPSAQVCASAKGCTYTFRCNEGANQRLVTTTFTPSPVLVETITAKSFPMLYLSKPVTAQELISKVEGATVKHVAKDYPEKLIKEGKAKELRSKFS